MSHWYISNKWYCVSNKCHMYCCCPKYLRSRIDKHTRLNSMRNFFFTSELWKWIGKCHCIVYNTVHLVCRICNYARYMWLLLQANQIFIFLIIEPENFPISLKNYERMHKISNKHVIHEHHKYDTALLHTINYYTQYCTTLVL